MSTLAMKTIEKLRNAQKKRECTDVTVKIIEEENQNEMKVTMTNLPEVAEQSDNTAIKSVHKLILSINSPVLSKLFHAHPTSNLIEIRAEPGKSEHVSNLIDSFYDDGIFRLPYRVLSFV